MRVLHLIDPGSPGGGGCTLRLLSEPLRRLTSVRQDVLLLGHRRHLHMAERCGVQAVGHLCPPRKLFFTGRRALGQLIDACESAWGAYDLIHSWTPRAAVLAALAAPNHKHIATFSVGPICSLRTQFLMAKLQRMSIPLLTATSATAREYRTMGIPRSLVSVLPPGVDPDAGTDMPTREEIRARWAREHNLTDQIFVVGAMSEPSNWADARTATEVLARVCISGRQARLVMHHSAARRLQAELYARQLGLHDLLIIDDEVAQPWRIINGLDAALLIGGELNTLDLSAGGVDSPLAFITGGGRRLRPMPGIMPLLWAFAAGVPVVAEASDAVRDIITDGHTGLLVNQFDVNAACDRLVRLHDDRTIGGRIATAASQVLRDQFSMSAYCVRLKQAYEQLLAGQTVRVLDDDDDPIVEQAMEAVAVEL